MKKFLQHIFIFVAVAYFLVLSLGFNLAHYCCAGCEEQGMELMALMACNEMSKDVQEPEEHSCCSESKAMDDCALMETADDCCTFSRLHTDIPVFHSKADFTHLLESFDFEGFTKNFLYYTGLSTVQEDYSYHNKIPPNTGRDILTRHAVLLI